MAEDYDYSKNISEYSKNIDERDTRAVESALEKYSYEIGNPKLPLNANDVFEVIDTDTHLMKEIVIKIRRVDGREFACAVNALSVYKEEKWSFENKKSEEVVTPYSGKWIVSLEGISYYKDEDKDNGRTMMELSEDGTTLKPVKKEDMLTLARYVEEEKRGWRSGHNFSYMEAMLKEATTKAFNLNEEGELKKNETLLEKGMSLFKKL